jgi:GMP synthase (glutamine-hydrolysing)
MKTRRRNSRQPPTVLVIQHVRSETPGKIGALLRAEGISTKVVRIFEGNKVPDELGEAAGLVIMGGPMGVYEQDRHPFLRQEIRLIEEALKRGKPVLGICLGSQLLASAVGARVRPGKRKEIGWYPVRLTKSARTDPLWKGVAGSFNAYHWHGDIFEVPRGAVSLASSALTKCQAFRYGRSAYGFLFHMEITEKIMRDMARTFTDELRAEGLDRAEILRGANEHLSRLNQIGSTVFSRWAGLISTTDEGTPAIKIKRVYESPELVEGSPFLVDRLWPHGLKKEALRGALWVRDVAPSDALRRWYGHDPTKWKEFRRRYFAELEGKREAWKPILEAVRRGGVVLLYSARDAEHNNAVALRDYLARENANVLR